MNIPEIIKDKRESWNLTRKEFSDAIGLGVDGGEIIRGLEMQEFDPTDEQLKMIKNFASNRPYAMSNSSPKFTFVDLFAGIGGIRIPFQELGGNCVFSSEWDKFSQKTYNINFGEKPNGDITKISADCITDFDILLGGFPCQPFSQAGLHKGFDDTRGTLFFEIERIIKAKRPKCFLLENVKQLRNHDNGRTLSVIKKHIEALNYNFESKVLRAAYFGIPQNRERIYMVGFDKKYYNLKDDYIFPFPSPTFEKTKVGDILESTVDPKYTISDALWEGHKRRKKENREKGNGFGYSLFTPESEYTNTISARYYKDGSEILIAQKENNPRKLTPRECARLQGFPEDFIIPVSDMQAYKQFGNSVAVPVVRAIATKMVAEMDRMENHRYD